MKANKKVSFVVICVLILANVNVDISYSLTIHGVDTSMRHSKTYVELPHGERVVDIPEGETRTVTVSGYDSYVVAYRQEAGWTRVPVKPTRNVNLSLREQTPVILAMGITSLGMSTRKRFAPEVPDENIQTTAGKKIVMLDLMYPYGKQKVYLNGSLITVAAQLIAMGHQVQIVDLNIDNLTDKPIRDKFRSADLIGVSIIGSPYIPSAIEFAREMKKLAPATVLVGGQVIENLSQPQFDALFSGTNAVWTANDRDLAKALGCKAEEIPNAYNVSLVPVFETMGPERMAVYLRREMTLVLAQGCVFNCAFCAARKNQAEVHRGLESFATDLHFLAKSAKNAGLEQIEFYASSLDFFQNPMTVAEHLKILATVQEEEKISIRVRCLACMGSFLRASEAIPDFGQLLKSAGLWCVGFGVDGTDSAVWKAENKRHNKIHDVPRCLALCVEIGVRPEILMVMGFPEDTLRTVSKTVWYALRYVTRWPNAVLRPYLAKPFIPGNRGWSDSEPRIKAIAQTPSLFYNLDFCAMGSRFTHPRWWHRWMSNLSYLLIIGILAPIGRCATSPLLPQGNGGLPGRLAKIINRLMPFDR